jgi:hypothetical protein
MTDPLPAAEAPAPARNRQLLIVYTSAIFVSALLLFSVQPLFTKMVLPRLGGTPAVWSVAMVFFQTLLLAGYAYAHFLMQLKSRKAPVIIHLVLLVCAILTLPLSISERFGEPPQSAYALWLLGLFTVSIALPFFALAANNPLLQAWFVRTGHPNGGDPYFLYASSNIGSFLALLSYPILLEPMFALRTQNLIWTGGYALLIALIATCGVMLLRSPVIELTRAESDAADAAAPAPAMLTRLRWIFLAAVPSGLLVAVTAHISADVASAPLLWVVPLSLYLLTWVLVFATRPILPHTWMPFFQPLAIAGAVALLAFGTERNLVATLVGNLVFFFIIAMGCHGELARTRPPAKYLTGFYVALSFGGMVGGLFAGLIAPYSFSWIAEYPILIVLAALCVPMLTPQPRWGNWLWLLVAIVGAVVLLPSFYPALKWSGLTDLLVQLSPTRFFADQTLFDTIQYNMPSVAVGVAVLGVLMAVLLNGERWKVAAMFAIALAVVKFYPADEGRVQTVRSFFGVHKIQETTDGRFHVLLHGTTIHGAQRVRNDDGSPVVGRPESISYYAKDGGIGRTVTAIRERKGTPMRVAVIGLGSGSLTCSAEAGEDWTFFEIDQSMVDTAKDPTKFSFIKQCMPDIKLVMGDARLTFAKEPDGKYDLIIVDAYSSDAIPVHLATEEAMEIYKEKLAPQGVVMMHVSNRHLELASVVVGIADANDMKSWVFNEDTGRDGEYIFSTQVVVSARDEADVGSIANSDVWELTDAPTNQRVWTDDYSNIIGAILRRMRYGEDNECPGKPFFSRIICSLSQ